jgi:hypothetical protein
MACINDVTMMSILSWSVWKIEIIKVLRRVPYELFADLGQEDVDWEAWKPLYDLGCDPIAAVAQAISVNTNTI